MMSHGVYDFVKSMICAKELTQNVDFVVISSTVMTEDFDLMSIETFSKKGLLGKKTILENSFTPFPKERNEDFVFFDVKETIDIGLATDLGLGVVQMLTGVHAGEQMIYIPFYGHGITKQWDDVNEIIALKAYLQLKHPEVYFESLDNLLHEHRELVEVNFIHNAKGYINCLYEIFSKHKQPILH